MAEVLGTDTKGVLEVLISLKDAPLTSSQCRTDLFNLEEELNRQKWDLNGHYDSKFYMNSSMRKSKYVCIEKLILPVFSPSIRRPVSRHFRDIQRKSIE